MLHLAALCVAGSLLSAPPARAGGAATASSDPAKLSKLPPVRVPPVTHPRIDHSGRKEVGKASYYSRRFDGRKTATGQRFNPNKATAASKTLPLGTTAKVVNLKNGKAATVTVNDRGPYVRSRMLDVSPKVAARLDMKHKGVAPVLVEPIAVPQPNGTVKLGAGAATVPPAALRADVRATKQAAPKLHDKTTGTP